MFREREIKPEIREEEKVREFSPSQALVKEKSVLNKLWGKARNTGKILFWVGCFTAGPAYAYTSGYSREASPTVAAEKVEAKKKDVRINKESLGVVAYITAQARENLKEKYPGDRNAMIIDGFGREVEALLNGLPDNGELIFKGDSTIVPDLSEAEERGKRVIFERIITKKTLSGVLPEVEQEVIEINHDQTVEIGKKEVAEMRDEIGAVLKAGKGLEEGEAIGEAKARAITEYWENTDRGKILREEIKETVAEKEITKVEVLEKGIENFDNFVSEKLKGEPMAQLLALDNFKAYLARQTITGEALKTVIKLSEEVMPSNAEDLIRGRKKIWNAQIEGLRSDIETKGVDFTEGRHSYAKVGESTSLRAYMGRGMVAENVHWIESLRLDQDRININRGKQLMQEMEKW